jgi:hypothetical protein
LSIDLFVQRGSGSRPGDNIVDPLVTSIPVALQRGRNELDKRAHAHQDGELETVYRSGVRAGVLARNNDMQSGEILTGKVTGIQHVIRKVNEAVQLTTTLGIER